MTTPALNVSTWLQGLWSTRPRTPTLSAIVQRRREIRRAFQTLRVHLPSRASPGLSSLVIGTYLTSDPGIHPCFPCTLLIATCTFKPSAGPSDSAFAAPSTLQASPRTDEVTPRLTPSCLPLSDSGKAPSAPPTTEENSLTGLHQSTSFPCPEFFIGFLPFSGWP